MHVWQGLVRKGVEALFCEEVMRLMSLKVEKLKWKVACYIVNHDSLPTGYRALILGDP